MDPLADISSLRVATPSLTPNQARAGSEEELREKAKELEGVFLNTLMSQMFSSIEAREGFGGGYAEETWRSMQAEQYAAMIAENGGIGLADEIVASLLQVQEAIPPQPIQNQQGAYQQ